MSSNPNRAPNARRGRRIALVGLPGVGKTTIGRLLADELAFTFFDCDAVFEAEVDGSIADWVRANGWATFRERECALLAAALAREEIVIATGGGVVEEARNRGALAAAKVIWLQAPLAVLGARLDSTNDRPLLADAQAERLAELAARRDPLYRQIADIEIAVADRTPRQAVALIMRELQRKQMLS
ncbi:MAG: shikimate kinase [Gammaproteobacteria bacterium]